MKFKPSNWFKKNGSSKTQAITSQGEEGDVKMITYMAAPATLTRKQKRHMKKMEKAQKRELAAAARAQAVPSIAAAMNMKTPEQYAAKLRLPGANYKAVAVTIPATDPATGETVGSFTVPIDQYQTATEKVTITRPIAVEKVEVEKPLVDTHAKLEHAKIVKLPERQLAKSVQVGPPGPMAVGAIPQHHHAPPPPPPPMPRAEVVEAQPVLLLESKPATMVQAAPTVVVPQTAIEYKQPAEVQAQPVQAVALPQAAVVPVNTLSASQAAPKLEVTLPQVTADVKPATTVAAAPQAQVMTLPKVATQLARHEIQIGPDAAGSAHNRSDEKENPTVLSKAHDDLFAAPRTMRQTDTDLSNLTNYAEKPVVQMQAAPTRAALVVPATPDQMTSGDNKGFLHSAAKVKDKIGEGVTDAAEATRKTIASNAKAALHATEDFGEKAAHVSKVASHKAADIAEDIEVGAKAALKTSAKAAKTAAINAKDMLGVAAAGTAEMGKEGMHKASKVFDNIKHAFTDHHHHEHRPVVDQVTVKPDHTIRAKGRALEESKQAAKERLGSFAKVKTVKPYARKKELDVSGIASDAASYNPRFMQRPDQSLIDKPTLNLAPTPSSADDDVASDLSKTPISVMSKPADVVRTKTPVTMMTLPMIEDKGASSPSSVSSKSSISSVSKSTHSAVATPAEVDQHQVTAYAKSPIAVMAQPVEIKQTATVMAKPDTVNSDNFKRLNGEARARLRAAAKAEIAQVLKDLGH